ncbi:MAG: muramoyltetrapeptide carboxypeptidase [Myxococcales bacterium]|nr:muramoyltetrapeptide carboxypeptidase [Myxococcales bacterium]
MDFTRPKPLRPGSLVAVCAPASPFDREELFRGLAWLRLRYRLSLSSSILARTGYLAGDDARRSAELAGAMKDPEVAAIVCARGGYGAMRIIDDLPWDAFVSSPKWLVGFSDVTALHVSANARAICSLHASNVTGLGRFITAAERASLIHGLEGLPLPAWTHLETIHRGPHGVTARGPVVGGNLALMVGMAAGSRLAIPDGAILAIEDVTERPYRLDRMLTSMRLGGHLARLSAIVLGGFTQCDAGPDGVTAVEVLTRCTADLGIPVVAGAPFGHGAPNSAFVLGGAATLDATTLRFD